MSILLQSKYYQIWSDNFRLRKSTKSTYIAALNKFEKFLIYEGFEGSLDFDKFHASRDYPERFVPIQRHTIDRFIQYLRITVKTTDRVIATTITSLKHFFQFLEDVDLIQHSPMHGYPRPKFESPLQNTSLSMEECISLLKAALLRDPFFRQDFVFLWFMLITGLRLSEVRFLRRKRLNIETKLVNIFEGHKTEKRSVAIPEDLASELERYIRHPQYVEYADQGNEFLFHQSGKIMSVQKVRFLLSELTIEAGLTRKIRPHDLRRTAAYLMQVGGMHIVDIQNQLRHKNVGTTLRYVPPLIELSKLLDTNEQIKN
ncbi:tyrosine-type recombinase/integrase [Paenibacillus sp. 2TAB23]|uniref:tyrosine-type recombinase/integrase n=1 Tax=Paenibacillus sp. 2TAB23 TaxID=3233004 RepID=UPI003F9D9A88